MLVAGLHHLFFVEYSVDGVSHIVANSPEQFSMANRAFIDFGIARSSPARTGKRSSLSTVATSPSSFAGCLKAPSAVMVYRCTT